MTEYHPGDMLPGGRFRFASPVEHGYVPADAPETPVIGLVAEDRADSADPTNPQIDWSFIRGLAYIPGNEYEEAA